MQCEIDDLPEPYREELTQIASIIFEEFDRTLRTATQRWKKEGRILKLLLCSPIVPEPLCSSSFPAAFDLLVVVNDRRLTRFPEHWSSVEARLGRSRNIDRGITRQVNILVHTLEEINTSMSGGAQFFADLIRASVTIYDDGAVSFSQPMLLNRALARSAAQAYFDQWFELSLNARALARFSIDRGVPRDAAFLFHQAVERAYHCLLLSLTLYSPKTHRLELLRAHSERIAPMLARVWPTDTKFERRCFELVRRSYVDARYAELFRVSEEELSWVDQRIGLLQDSVRIEKTIDDLPSLTRKIFKARREESLEYELIADQLGLSVEEVEIRMAQALETIAISTR